MKPVGIIQDCKSTVFKKIMLGTKSFNARHRNMSRIATYLTLILLVILSILFLIPEFICSFLTGILCNRKRAVGIIMSIVLLAIARNSYIWVPGDNAIILTEAAESKEEDTEEVTEKDISLCHPKEV